MSKYSSVATVVDGIRFDSKKEAARYLELSLLQKAGVITNIKLQPKFELQPKFVNEQGRTERAITYRADFMYSVYSERGKVIVEDVKGMKTEVYKLKRKMFLFRFPQYKFVEV